MDEATLHDYQDRLEDLQVEVRDRLLAIVSGMLSDADLNRLPLIFTRQEAVRALAGMLASQLGPRLVAGSQAAALSNLESAVSGTALASTFSELQRALGGGKATVLPAKAGQRATVLLASGIEQALTGIGQNVSRAVTEARMTSGDSEATARALLQSLRADLESGGPIFRGLTEESSYTAAVRSVSGMVADTATTAAAVQMREGPMDAERLARVQGNEQMRWIAMLVNTCPDCLMRHGQVDSRRNWELRGLPGTSWSVCKQHCQCRQVPAFAGPGSMDWDTASGPLQASAETLIERTRNEGLRRTQQVEGQKLKRGLTFRVPSDLLEREARGKDIRINAETGEVVDTRRNRILAAAKDDIEVRRALRELGKSGKL